MTHSHILHYLLVPALVIGLHLSTTAAVILDPTLSATITDEDGDGTPDVVGEGFGHPGDPNYGTTLVQLQQGVYERRSVEEFSLSGITSVQSATLTFYFNAGIFAPAVNVDTQLFGDDGQITLGDFSAVGTDLGVQTIPANAPNSNNWYITYDVTSALQALVAQDSPYLAAREQIGGTFGGNSAASFQLNVTVPEPDSSGYLMIGLAGWIAFRIFRRKPGLLTPP